MKVLDVPPFEVLEHRGMTFVYDTQATVFVRVEDSARDCVLALRECGSMSGVRRSLLGQEAGGPPPDALTQLEDLIARDGLLRGPVTTYDNEDYERLVRRCLRMSTGNIELYLAEACNLRCRYCYVQDNDALGNGLMPEEVALAAVDLVFRRSRGVDTIQITFFGGEPLLNKPVLNSVIDYSQARGRAHGKRVTYSITTNGTLIDDEIIGLIKRYNFGLMISMDGPPDVHDAMRPMADGTGSFALAASKVKRLMRRRHMVTARTTVSRNCMDLQRIVEYLEDFGFTRVGLSYCVGTSTELGEHDILPEDRPALDAEFDKQLDRWIERVKRGDPLRNDPCFASLRAIHKPEKTPAPMLQCGVCRGCTTVGVDGSLYPCHRYVGNANWVVGDVWRGVSAEKHEAYLRGYFTTKGKCESCWAVRWCGGMCPWYVSTRDGGFAPPPDHRCDALKRSIVRSAWLYERVREECPEFLATLDEFPDDRALTAAGRPTPSRPGSARTPSVKAPQMDSLP